MSKNISRMYIKVKSFVAINIQKINLPLLQMYCYYRVPILCSIKTGSSVHDHHHQQFMNLCFDNPKPFPEVFY